MNDTQPLTLATLRRAIKGLPGQAVLVPSHIYSMYVKLNGEVIGYISDQGFQKFDKPKEETCPPRPRKDTFVQVENVTVDNISDHTQVSPTVPTPVANADGCQTKDEPKFPAQNAESIGSPGAN